MWLRLLMILSRIFQNYLKRRKCWLFAVLEVIWVTVDNGGDGLIAARHLKLFGIESEIFYPKRPKSDVLEALVQQAEGMEIPFLKELGADLPARYFLFLDAIFGYSFKGA